MSSRPLPLLEADPDDADLGSDLDLDSPDAETSLLQDYPDSRDESPLPRGQSPSTSPPRHRHYVGVIAISLCAAFLIEIGDFMQRAPITRVLEDILCRKYYESVQPLGTQLALPIPEEHCKGSVVQGQLAMLRGWDSAFGCIPTLLLALPYGYVADRYGRKIVLMLGLLGLTLAFSWSLFVVSLDPVLDVRWVWAGNLFLCIGGGPAVLKAALYAIFADVTPENKRASVFFQFIAATMLSVLVGVPFAWYLMQRSPLLALSVGLGFVCVGLFLVLFLPETLDRTKLSEASSLTPNSDESLVAEELLESSKPLTIFGVIKGSRSIFATPALRFLIITFVTSPILLISMSFLVQFASERYHWSIADTSFIGPFNAIAIFVMLVVVLPLMYSFLDSRLGMRPAMRDLVVARGSLIFLVLGCLAIALAPAPGLLITGTLIIALGSGFMPAVRSLVTSYVRADQVSRLYGVVAIIETLGALLASPLISKSFSWGMSLGGLWTGMSFILTGAMTLILGLPVWIIRPPKPEEDVHD